MFFVPFCIWGESFGIGDRHSWPDLFWIAHRNMVNEIDVELAMYVVKKIFYKVYESPSSLSQKMCVSNEQLAKIDILTQRKRKRSAQALKSSCASWYKTRKPTAFNTRTKHAFTSRAKYSFTKFSLTKFMWKFFSQTVQKKRQESKRFEYIRWAKVI